MTAWDITKLPWLLPAPSDFNDRLRTANVLPKDEKMLLLQSLATASLNVSQLTKLGACLQKAVNEKTNIFPFQKFRLAILSNSTMNLLGPALIGAAARYGIALELFIASYDQVMQESLDPNSALHASKHDAVFLCLDYRALPLQNVAFGSEEKEEEVVQEAIAYVTRIRDAMREYNGAPTIFQTLPKVPIPLFGSYDVLTFGTPLRIFEKFNEVLKDVVKDSGDYILDTCCLAERVGIEAWNNPKHWNMYKIPYDQSMAPLYVDYIARLLGSIKGNNRKCLVLDLDNTLWGGVIGDDGLEGIVLGQGDPIGESFLEVQKTVLMLRNRGVILAVCSKNEEETARLPFRSHPEMILKEEDISIFIANWDDKASNLTRISSSLNIGIDSLVLLDDNPAERAQVRCALPMVAVPELPLDSAYYSRALLSAGYFEAVNFSQEDKDRVQQYQSNVKRGQLLAQVTDVATYLKSLKMKITLAPFDNLGLPRIVQLINKSNQFNLTTRRYSEAELRELMRDPNIFTLQARLSDRFGDSGMISIIICRLLNSTTWQIDTWLMSCRVIGRNLEHALLNEVVDKANISNIKTLQGIFKPTGKNNMVRNHYEKLGFRYKNSQGNDTLWSLKIAEYQPYNVLMEVIILKKIGVHKSNCSID